MLRYLALLLFCFTLFAQGPQTTPPPQPPTQPQHTSEYQLTPERRAKAIEYSRKGYELTFFSFFYGLLQIAIILSLRISVRLRDFAEGALKHRAAQLFLFLPLFLLLSEAFDLPVALYRHSLAVAYGQSVQTWAAWTLDYVKGAALGLFFSTLAFALLYYLIRRSPQRWWLIAWGLMIPILVITIWLVPVLIEPLFYKFTPLAGTQPALVNAIETVVHRGGLTIPENRMFEMNASSKVNSVNAYVTGFGSSKRVVVWDTTIKKMTTPETLFVFGHEMGHYVLNHIYKGLLFSIAGLFLGLYIVYRVLEWLVIRYGPRWHIAGAGDMASLPLVLLVSSVMGFASQPIDNGFSRYVEHQADVYGLEVTHGLFPQPAETAAHAFQVLGETNLSDPDPSPFIKFWLYSHPPIPDRIRFAQQYDPWSTGQPREFVP